MTAGEIIAGADKLRANSFSENDKLGWLERLDGQIFREVIMTHSGGKSISPPVPGTYTAETELIVPFPYAEELYDAYIFMQIDFANAEIARYNQSAALFAAAYRSFADDFNRRKSPAGERRFKM